MKHPRGFDDFARAPEGEPDHAAHRQRLKQRFLSAGVAGVADYELLELVLFSAIPRRDVKPLANVLLKRFGSFAEVLSAPPKLLQEVDGVGDSVVTTFKIVEAAAQKLLRGPLRKKTVLGSWSAVVDYCRAQMAFVEREEFRILFLDKRNMLLIDEVQGVGTIDHTPVYPREVIKRALELGATAMILVHNHPSGDPTPSAADVAMTQEIIGLAKPMGIEVHDHLIVGRNGHTSMRARPDWGARR